MSKKIAITAPVYNIEKKYLKKMVKSLIKQTYDNWELILVDDGSKKETADYLDELALLDNRIKVIHQKNAGCVEARRTGFRAMKDADYVTTIDSDDYIPCDALEIMIKAAEKYGADLVAGESQKVAGKIKLPFRPSGYFLEEKAYNHKEIIDDLLISYFGWNKIPVTVWGKLYDKKFLPLLAEGEIVTVFTATDANASLNVFPHSEKLAVVPKSVYCYRTGGGTSKFRADYMEETLNYYRYRIPFIDEYLSDFSGLGGTAYDIMAAELKNEVRFHLKRFVHLNKATDKEAIDMIESFYEVPEIKDAFENHSINNERTEFISAFNKKDSKKVLELIKEEIAEEKKRDRYKNLIKTVLERL